MFKNLVNRNTDCTQKILDYSASLKQEIKKQDER